VLESANMNLYWDGFIRTDRTVDCNRPDIVFMDRENKTVLLIDLAFCLTYKLSNTEAEKIMKIWPWKSKISGSLTVYSYTP